MRFPIKSLAVAVAAAAPFIAAPASVNAAPVQGAAALNSAAAPVVEQVQWRRGWRGGPRYRHHYYRRGPGPGLGLGLAAGAIIGGAIASQNAQASANAYEYCSQRFKSYDPRSGTYLGYDGYRHPCP